MSKAAELAKWGEVSTNGQVSGRRNIVINGAMQVAQRSASVTGIGAAGGYFTLDRWKIDAGASAGRLTMTQTADGPSGFANCLKLDCTTADTSIAASEYLILAQYFEGQDLQSIGKGVAGAKEITVSFYVKGNASATYTVELRDVDNSRRNSQEFPVTTDWVRITRTFVADTTGTLDDDNAGSFALQFWLHAGATYAGGTHTDNVWHATSNQIVGDNNTSFFDSTDRTFFITGLQLEVGSVATPFEHRSYGEELALCQRYYYHIQGSAKSHIAKGLANDARAGHFNFELPTSMRHTYTLVHSGLTTLRWVVEANSEKIPDAFALSSSNSLDITSVRMQHANNVTTVGYACGMLLLDANAYIAFDAEL